MALQYQSERPLRPQSTISRRHLQASVEEGYELSGQSTDQDGEDWSSDSGLDAPLPPSPTAKQRSSSKPSRRTEPELKPLSMQQRYEQRNTPHSNNPRQTSHSKRPNPNPGGQVYFSPHSRNTQPAQSYDTSYTPPYGYPESPAYPHAPYLPNFYPNAYSYPYAQTQPYSTIPTSQQPGTYNATPNTGQSNPYMPSSSSQYSTRNTSSNLNREVNELKTIIQDFKRDERRKREENIAEENKAKAKREREKKERRKAREKVTQLKREAEEREMVTQQELSDLRRGIKQSLNLMQQKIMETQDNRWNSGRARASQVDYMLKDFMPKDWRLPDGHGEMNSLRDEMYEYLRNKRLQEERRSIGGGEVDDDLTGSLERGLQVTTRPAMQVMDPDSLRKMIGSVLMELLPTLNEGPSLERDKESANEYATKRIKKNSKGYAMKASKLREMYDWGKSAAEKSEEDAIYPSLKHSDFDIQTAELEVPPIAPRVSPQYRTSRTKAKTPLRGSPELVRPKAARLSSLDSGYSSLVGRSSARRARDPQSPLLNRKPGRPKGAEKEEAPESSPTASTNMKPSKYCRPSVCDVGENSSSEESDSAPIIRERERRQYRFFKMRAPVEAPTPPFHSSDSDE